MLSPRKKLMNQSQENFCMEGRKDRQTLIHSILLVTARGPINAPPTHKILEFILISLNIT